MKCFDSQSPFLLVCILTEPGLNSFIIYTLAVTLPLIPSSSIVLSRLNHPCRPPSMHSPPLMHYSSSHSNLKPSFSTHCPSLPYLIPGSIWGSDQVDFKRGSITCTEPHRGYPVEASLMLLLNFNRPKQPSNNLAICLCHVWFTQVEPAFTRTACHLLSLSAPLVDKAPSTLPNPPIHTDASCLTSTDG